jgi:hypothetical protein
METTLKQGGLSARRKTFYKVLISSLGFLVASSLFLSSCNEKTQGQHSEERNQATSISKDSLRKPQISVNVNKRYDDKGNVVGFDSTYTSFYSNVQGDTARMDSLMMSFDHYFKRDHSLLFQRDFNSLFFNDSMRYNDFFHDDFFLKRYESNDRYFRGMMDRMDSIKNQFYFERSKKEKSKDSGDL